MKHTRNIIVSLVTNNNFYQFQASQIPKHATEKPPLHSSAFPGRIKMNKSVHSDKYCAKRGACEMKINILHSSLLCVAADAALGCCVAVIIHRQQTSM